MAYNPLLQGLTFSQQAAQQYQQAQQQTPGLNLGQLAQQAQQQTPGLNLGQLAQQAHNQFNSAYNAYAQQGMNQHMAAQQQRQFNPNTWIQQRWMIDGKYMSLQQFVNFIWPEDCAEKTFFVLKHTKEIEND